MIKKMAASEFGVLRNLQGQKACTATDTKAVILSMTALLFAAAITFAQDVSPHVEVASIKPSRPDATVRDAAAGFRPGRFDATNATLTEILNALRGYDGRQHSA